MAGRAQNAGPLASGHCQGVWQPWHRGTLPVVSIGGGRQIAQLALVRYPSQGPFPRRQEMDFKGRKWLWRSRRCSSPR